MAPAFSLMYLELICPVNSRLSLSLKNSSTCFFNSKKLFTEIIPPNVTSSSASAKPSYFSPIITGISKTAGSNVLCNPVAKPPPTYAMSA